MNKHVQPSRHSAPLPSGRDELNLIDFPIGVLKYQQPMRADGSQPDELVCTIESYDRHLDRVVPRKLTRRTASRHGFPTPVEEEVLVGLLTLTRLKNEFKSPRVSFRNSELYELMGWANNGNSNKQLSIALDRLKGLNLKYENAWTTGGDQFHKEFTTGLLDSYEFVTRAGSLDSDAASWIQWASEIFADIQQGNVKPLDTDRYFALKRPIAKRLYRFLDKCFGQSRELEMDLLKLAAHVGIANTSHIGKIKERLAPSIRELEELGDFLAPASSRYSEQGAGRWTIRIATGTSQSNARLPRTSETKPRASISNDDVDAKELVKTFYRLWSGDETHRISRHELSQAQTLFKTYGLARTTELLPIVVHEMKQSFPNARVFGATKTYWHTADESLNRRNKRQQKVVSQVMSDQEAEQRRDAERLRLQSLRQQWRQLSPARQAEIREQVTKTCSDTVRGFINAKKYDDPLVMRACIEEMQRRGDPKIT